MGVSSCELYYTEGVGWDMGCIGAKFLWRPACCPPICHRRRCCTAAVDHSPSPPVAQAVVHQPSPCPTLATSKMAAAPTMIKKKTTRHSMAAGWAAPAHMPQLLEHSSASLLMLDAEVVLFRMPAGAGYDTRLSDLVDFLPGSNTSTLVLLANSAARKCPQSIPTGPVCIQLSVCMHARYVAMCFWCCLCLG